MMRPGIIAGWIILVTIFMREFSATLFLYSPGAEPLGPLLCFLYLDGMRGRVAAIGLVISVISVILIAIAQRSSRWDSKRDKKLSRKGAKNAKILFFLCGIGVLAREMSLRTFRRICSGKVITHRRLRRL